MGIRKYILPFFVVFLIGCQTELYSGVSQKEGNEMLAILLEAGIDTQKLPGKEGKVKITVEESQLSFALDTLKRKGYPKEHFSSLKEVFPSEGLITSPLQEKAKLNYFKSQNLASTLSQIDGVVSARVHIVEAEEVKASEIGKKGRGASASIFIKHSPNFDISLLIPQIKILAENSIGNIAKENIGVVLVASEESIALGNVQKVENILSIKVADSSKNRFYMLIGFLIFLILITNLITYFVAKSK